MKKVVKLISLLTILFVPFSVSATTLYFDMPKEPVKVGDTVLVKARLDTESQVINVVDGNIKILGAENIAISDLSVAGSDLSFWARKPSWSDRDKTISFVGGAPGGFSKPNGLLFTVAVSFLKTSTTTFEAGSTLAYQNDGVGTAVSVVGRPLSLFAVTGTGIRRDEWRDTVAGDNEGPTLTAVEIGRDPSLFDNAFFLSIHATDGGSGVHYYEVQEGAREPVRTGATYMLQNQSLSEPITVYAYDWAGNRSEKRLNEKPVESRAPSAARPMWPIVIVLVFVIAGIVFAFRTRKPKKNETAS